MTSVHVAIGNSDDKLAQAEWSQYVARVDALVRGFADTMHGTWHSPPAAGYQSAAWTFDVSGGSHGISTADDLKARLALIATKYRQDSIAWLTGDTEFITPPTPETVYTIPCEFGRMPTGDWCEAQFVWAGPATDIREAESRAYGRAQEAGWTVTTTHGRRRAICDRRSHR